MAGLFSLWAVHQTDAFVSDHQRKNGIRNEVGRRKDTVLLGKSEK